MSVAEFKEAVRARFRDEVVEQFNGFKHVLDNGPEPDPRPNPWCRFSVACSPLQQVSTGDSLTARFRCTIIATANVFEPLQKGDATSTEIADAIVAAFLGWKLTSPDLSVQSAGIVGVPTRDPNGAWSKSDVTITIRADQIGAGS